MACLAFSPDGRLLAAQGGPPEWVLVAWNWEKSKAAGVVRTCSAAGAPVHQARPRRAPARPLLSDGSAHKHVGHACLLLCAAGGLFSMHSVFMGTRKPRKAPLTPQVPGS